MRKAINHIASALQRILRCAIVKVLWFRHLCGGIRGLGIRSGKLHLFYAELTVCEHLVPQALGSSWNHSSSRRRPKLAQLIHLWNHSDAL